MIKVAEAVSGEVALEKLIDTLMRIAIEHAGAGGVCSSCRKASRYGSRPRPRPPAIPSLSARRKRA